MSKEENQELENFIQDWYWDEKSHKFAQNFGLYLFQFIAHLQEMGLSERTVRKHRSNCWSIGIFEYSVADRQKRRESTAENGQ
ncbi:MAG: hypothetical protein QNJ70_30380 [Xenococcaceae cyanobacterium MO_207.B15]|nr:hypothetical protein [Xenococcaceae cyanobacterium MO_207.B15]